MSNIEKTLSIIKPDAVERNLIDEIKKIFLKNDLKIKESKKIHITKDEAAEFYKVHNKMSNVSMPVDIPCKLSRDRVVDY